MRGHMRQELVVLLRGYRPGAGETVRTHPIWGSGRTTLCHHKGGREVATGLDMLAEVVVARVVDTRETGETRVPVGTIAAAHGFRMEGVATSLVPQGEVVMVVHGW